MINLSTGYCQRHNTTVVAQGMNASLNDSSLTCLLGPNGGGKSTLLRTLSAFQPPLDGKIKVMDKGLGEYTHTECARIIAVVLTERVDADGMTVSELVAMGRSPYTGFWGGTNDDDQKVVNESLRMVGMSSFARRHVHTLSDGERQKVMIAKALAQDTPVILLDEPTAFLDYTSRVELMRLLQSLAHDKGKTILVSTHDVDLAMLMADNIWLIDREHGLATGTPSEVTAKGHLARYFPGIEQIFSSIAGLMNK